MDFIAYPSLFSSASSSSFGNFIERVREACHFAVSAIIGNIFSAIFTFFFALGWSFFFPLRFSLLFHVFLWIGIWYCFLRWVLQKDWIFGLVLYWSVNLCYHDEFACSYLYSLLFFTFGFWFHYWIELQKPKFRIHWRQKWVFFFFWNKNNI